MERGLNGGCVWKETPIEIKHSQETSDLADSLGRGTDLQICNTFRERLGTCGCNFATKERNFGDTENTLEGVQQDAIRLEFSEEGVEVLVVFLRGTAEDKDVVYIGKTEIQVFEDLITKHWKVWAAFCRPKDIKGNSKRPKGVVIAVFWMSSGLTGIWW